ncbi:hypothetical protein Tco_0455786 [Tanacetum coccineum]
MLRVHDNDDEQMSDGVFASCFTGVGQDTSQVSKIFNIFFDDIHSQDIDYTKCSCFLVQFLSLLQVEDCASTLSFRNCYDRMLVWGKLDLRNFAKKESMKKLFKNAAWTGGEVTTVHAYYNLVLYKLSNEDPRWSTSSDKEIRRHIRFGSALVGLYLCCFVHD